MNLRIWAAAAAAGLAFVTLVGCSSSEASQGPLREQSLNYANSSDKNSCPGFPTFSFHSGWVFKDGNQLVHAGDGTVVKAYCNTRAHFDGTDWTLVDVVDKVYGPALSSNPAPRRQNLTLAGHDAVELTYGSHGTSYTMISLLIGDRLVQLQAATPGPSSKSLQAEIDDVLRSAKIAED